MSKKKKRKKISSLFTFLFLRFSILTHPPPLLFFKSTLTHTRAQVWFKIRRKKCKSTTTTSHRHGAQRTGRHHIRAALISSPENPSKVCPCKFRPMEGREASLASSFNEKRISFNPLPPTIIIFIKIEYVKKKKISSSKYNLFYREKRKEK